MRNNSYPFSFSLRNRRLRSKVSSEGDSHGGTKMAANEEERLLSSDQIEEFHRRGVLVIRNFLSADEVHEARRGEDIIQHKVHWTCSLS